MTYNACGVTKWNNGVSYPIQSGHGCIGCSENGFWDNGPFYQHLASFPGFGIESTADTIGTALGPDRVRRRGLARHNNEHPKAKGHSRTERRFAVAGEDGRRR